MNKKTIYILSILAAILGIGYFGFFREYKSSGVSWYKYISFPIDLSKIDRKAAITVIEQWAGAKMMGSYGDDYLIARAKAILLKQEYFYLNNKNNKYNTSTGRAVSLTA